jgi:DNA repair protein RadC
MTEGQAKPEYYVMIRDLPAAERPRERLRSYGPSHLSNAELLAIILRTGTASESVLSLGGRLLSQFGGLAGLARANYDELRSIHGFGEAKTAQLKAAFELGRRLLSLQENERAVIHSPQDVANLLQGEMAFLEQEHLRVVLLNTRNQVLAIPEVYKGNVSSAVVRPGEVFREAVRSNAPAVIVVHNHPSGDPTPSQEDIQITGQLIDAGKLLDVEVLDHVVVAQNGFISLKEKGLGFE